MANTQPPQLGKITNVVDLREVFQAAQARRDSQPGAELEERKDDTGRSVDNVVSLRREEDEKADLTQIPKAPQLPTEIPAIARGERVSDKKVAEGEDEKQKGHIRGSLKVDRIAGYMDLTGEKVSAEDTARALIKLCKDDVVEAFADKKCTPNDDDDLFIPVAETVLRMYPGNEVYRKHIDDRVIISLIVLLRDNDDPNELSFRKIADKLEDFARRYIAGKRVPATVKGRGRARI